MSLKDKSFEIFSGTGGVGKTTIATSRAISLAKAGKKVLLITIDPSKRLKEILGLKDSQAGEVISVHNPLGDDPQLSLDVELMNPGKTFEKMAKLNDCSEVLNNRILSILTKPYGGLNEILSIVELNYQYESKQYDTIVLDTPPGGHFLDFLDSVNRIQVFFDQSFIEIFQYLGKKINSTPVNFGKKLFTMVVSTGIKKLLSYLQKVTGETFVDEFIDAVIAIYKTKNSFLTALKLQDVLKSSEHANWFLVTSVEQNKIDEAIELKKKVSEHLVANTYVVLNKSLEEHLEFWTPKSEQEETLKNSLKLKESSMQHDLRKSFKNIFLFSEIFAISPIDHVNELTEQWIQKNTQRI